MLRLAHNLAPLVLDEVISRQAAGGPRAVPQPHRPFGAALARPLHGMNWPRSRQRHTGRETASARRGRRIRRRAMRIGASIEGSNLSFRLSTSAVFLSICSRLGVRPPPHGFNFSAQMLIPAYWYVRTYVNTDVRMY